mmetsp:Transcript_11946/g.24176  ORF Transcript_11946/g.24176 Transcript_11946/m.24176 type:complete len:84 (-) Transcript_11946:8-259(-)
MAKLIVVQGTIDVAEQFRFYTHNCFMNLSSGGLYIIIQQYPVIFDEQMDSGLSMLCDQALYYLLTRSRFMCPPCNITFLSFHE